MPVFRSFDADIRQQADALGVRRASGDAFGGQIGAATANFGATVTGQAGQVFDMLEQRELLKTTRKSAAIRRQALEMADELRDQGQPAAEQVQGFLDQEFEKLTNSRTFQRSREDALESEQRRFAEIGRITRANDAALVASQVSEDIDTILQDEGVVLVNNPDLLPVVADEFRRTIDDFGTLTAAKKQTLIRGGQARLARNAVEGWIDIDPDVALEKLRDGQFDDMLSGEAKVIMEGRAKERIRTLAREEDRDRKEANLRKAKTNSKVMTDTFNAVFDSEQHLSHGDIESLSRQTHEDGTPVLQSSQVLQLHSLIEQRSNSASGSLATNPSLAAKIYPRVLRGSISLEELQELRAEGLLSQAEFERYSKFVNEGPTPLRRARKTAIGRIQQRLDPDGLRFFDPATQGRTEVEVGRVLDEMGTLMLEREEEFRKAEKNPVDYYASDQFGRDFQEAAAQIEEVELASGATQSQAGVPPVGTVASDGEGSEFVFKGGDPNDLDNNWLDTSTPEGRELVGKPSVEVETKDGTKKTVVPEDDNIVPGTSIDGILYQGGGRNDPEAWIDIPADVQVGDVVEDFVLTPTGQWARTVSSTGRRLKDEIEQNAAQAAVGAVADVFEASEFLRTFGVAKGTIAERARNSKPGFNTPSIEDDRNGR